MLSPKQQQQASNEINAQLNKMQLSWSSDLKEWHPHAINALNFTSAAQMQVPQTMWRKLLEQDTHGINANVVAILCNNIESRTPKEMNANLDDWADILELNQRVADSWEAMCAPVRESVIKRIELAAGVEQKKIISMHSQS